MLEKWPVSRLGILVFVMIKAARYWPVQVIVQVTVQVIVQVAVQENRLLGGVTA